MGWIARGKETGSAPPPPPPECTALPRSGPAARGVLYWAWLWHQAELSEESLSHPVTITWASHLSSWSLSCLVCKMGIRFHSPHRDAEESNKKTIIQHLAECGHLIQESMSDYIIRCLLKTQLPSTLRIKPWTFEAPVICPCDLWLHLLLFSAQSALVTLVSWLT